MAGELDPVVETLCERFGLSVCFRDPGVGEFGLHNALMTIGDQFLEVVAPTEDGTTAGRLLDRRGGDGGYMAIYEVDDLDRRVEHLREHDVRIVWSLDLPDIRGRHLHPRDVGGAIVSVDEPLPAGSWRWAGPDWTAHSDTSVVSGIAGVTVSAADPVAMRARWAEPSSTTRSGSSSPGPGARASTVCTWWRPTVRGSARPTTSAASPSPWSDPRARLTRPSGVRG